MDYQEFVSRLGELQIPEGDVYRRLIRGEDSIHIGIVIGKIIGDEFSISLTSLQEEFILKTVALLESRGAKRGETYAVCCNLRGDDGVIEVSIHSTDEFLSEEDF